MIKARVSAEEEAVRRAEVLSGNTTTSGEYVYSRSVHLVSNNKGGIGKSLVANWLAQYLTDSDRGPTAFDTDPSNPTFSRVKSLAVERFDMIDNRQFNAGKFDTLVQRVVSQPGPFVIDTGSDGFHAMWKYIEDLDLFNLLAEEGNMLMVHVPLAAVPDFEDTLFGFERIADLAPARSVVLWLNEINRPIGVSGTRLLDMPELRERESKLAGVVLNSRQRTGSFYGDAVGQMLSAKQTFREAIQSATARHDIATRRRLEQVRDEVYRQLGDIGL